MKKIIFILLIVTLLVVGYSYDQFLWCKKLLLGEPTTHVIQKGESLSKIAKKYYGRTDYWKELSLVNRAPNSNLVFPGEEIIIPSEKVIREIRHTRWLSKVNTYIKGQENILAQLQEEPETTLAMESASQEEKQLKELPIIETEEPVITDEQVEPAETDVQSASSLFLIFTVIGILLVASIVGFLLYRRKHNAKMVTFDEEEEGLDLMDDDKEAESDYPEFLREPIEKKEEEALLS